MRKTYRSTTSRYGIPNRHLRYTMRDVVVAIAIPEEPATVGQQTMTSGSAETNETTRHSKPVAANEDPDATDDYADAQMTLKSHCKQ